MYIESIHDTVNLPRLSSKDPSAQMPNPFALPVEPLDEAFALMDAFKADSDPYKVSLGAGVYRTSTGLPYVLPSVRMTKDRLHADPASDHEYLPIHGSDVFLAHSSTLLFGKLEVAASSSISSIQTVSGSGANHLAALFLGQFLKPKNVWISDPTWMNHHSIWAHGAPNVNIQLYPYYDAATRSLDFTGMMAALETAEQGDVVLLHACAHNPTGIDPTRAQWEKVAKLIKDKKLFALFDSAYQGFASGDAQADAWAVRRFRDVLFEDDEANVAGMAVCQSFSKNFGLYGERVGALHLVLPSSVQSAGARSQMVALVRAEISTTPRYGSKIVETILGDEQLTRQWEEDLKEMADRIIGMRKALRDELERLGTSGDWSHVTSQIGMFSFTGLNPAQVARMRDVHHVYLLGNGRASLSGLNEGNVEYVAKAFHEVVEWNEQKKKMNL